MKQTLSNQQTLKQRMVFHTALYDSLDILKLSGYELMESVYEALQENPLLDIDDTPTSVDVDTAYDRWNTLSEAPHLKDHLYLQLHTCKETYDEVVCSYLIESLDKHGFFTESIQDTATLLNTNEEHITTQLRLIQSFEPAGVAAASSIDALILQCERKREPIATLLLKEHLDTFFTQSTPALAKKLSCSREDIEHALTIIHHLQPYPCSAFSNEEEQTVLADVSIHIEDEQLIIKPVSHFQLHYNDFYMDLLKSNPVLKTYFEQSKLLMANISKRNATMMLVFHEIINTQASHFLYQDELRPLKQSDVAKKLGIHQATISRAIMNKYYLFENDIYPIANLFVTTTEHGDSSDAIKKAIRDILNSEDKQHPLSDRQLLEVLLEYDYRISRRTVTKYREACGFGSTRERKIKYMK